jgi:hypothetical protein
VLAGFDLGQGHAGGATGRRRGVDRIAVRTGLGVAEHLVEARLDPGADRPLGLASSSDSASRADTR